MPPEYSPYGRNATGFYNHLTGLIYTYASSYDRMYFCGDINARIGKLTDSSADIDIELPSRHIIDEKDNNHGKGFIEFLTENKFCVLNGRFDKNVDNFTYIGRGKSVVDYIFCPHDNFEYCSNFSVITSKEIINCHSLHSFIGEKSKPPDHSLLKVNIQMTGLISVNTVKTVPCTSTSNDDPKYTVYVKRNAHLIQNFFVAPLGEWDQKSTWPIM